MKKVLAGWFVMMLVLGCVCNQNTFVYGAEFGVKIGTQRLESGSGKTELSFDVRFNIWSNENGRSIQ
jgi:hypothetical protein